MRKRTTMDMSTQGRCKLCHDMSVQVELRESEDEGRKYRQRLDAPFCQTHGTKKSRRENANSKRT